MAGTQATPPGRTALLFHRHRLGFVAVNAALTIINVFTGAPWWAFWPLFLWGIALTVHYLWYRATTVDDEWVEARIGDLRSKSYDLSHMDDIRQTPGGASPNPAGPSAAPKP